MNSFHSGGVNHFVSNDARHLHGVKFDWRDEDLGVPILGGACIPTLANGAVVDALTFTTRRRPTDRDPGALWDNETGAPIVGPKGPHHGG